MLSKCEFVEVENEKNIKRCKKCKRYQVVDDNDEPLFINGSIKSEYNFNGLPNDHQTLKEAKEFRDKYLI